MSKRVLDVGNCVPDHTAITKMVTGAFDAVVLGATDLADAQRVLKSEPVDLIVVNRKLDCDYSDGLDVIKGLKADPKTADIPVMLISNYPEAHAEAVAIGAIQGFGKNHLSDPATINLLRPFLD